jgi:DnaJ-class molecular chaperone
MTPYAVLLVKPTDSDEVIRKTYHRIAERNHPDANGGVAGALWHAATAAYTTVKTEEKREAWAHKQALLSGLCTECEGYGVRGTRMFKGKIRVCAECKGEGRI